MIDVLGMHGPLHSVYNLKGFKARASEIVADDRGEIRPGARITLEPTEPPIRFPLISETALASGAFAFGTATTIAAASSPAMLELKEARG